MSDHKKALADCKEALEGRITHITCETEFPVCGMSAKNLSKVNVTELQVNPTMYRFCRRCLSARVGIAQTYRRALIEREQ